MSTKPHYLGHRQRLKDRFMRDAGASLPDYEMLELVLFLAKPRAEVKPLAKALITRFGSFADVISADVKELVAVKGVGENTAVARKTIRAAAIRLAREQVMNQPVITSWQKLLDYCRASLAFAKTEEFRVLFLDRKNVLIADEMQQTGTVDHTPVYPREVVKRALDLGASAIIMVHNLSIPHPRTKQNIFINNMLGGLGQVAHTT